jgi:excisionase family DNA binding protein
MSKKKFDADELISLAEASRRYGLGTDYLRRIAANGRLVARKIGRDWLTTPKDVEAYLKSRQKKGAYRDDLES